MKPTLSEERQARAARNETLFRTLNEKLTDLNEALASVSQTLVIACECAEMTCVAMVDISPADYNEVRSDPTWFVVLPDHVYPEIERVVREADGYVVVEKFGLGGEIAEADAATDDKPGGS